MEQPVLSRAFYLRKTKIHATSGRTFSPSMATREARLRPFPGRLRPLTAALRREAPCAGDPARFDAYRSAAHEHPRS